MNKLKKEMREKRTTFFTVMFKWRGDLTFTSQLKRLLQLDQKKGKEKSKHEEGRRSKWSL